MSEKSNIDKAILDAYNRGRDYLAVWRACAPSVFAAIMDVMGYGDDPVVNGIWKATIGLSR